MHSNRFVTPGIRSLSVIIALVSAVALTAACGAPEAKPPKPPPVCPLEVDSNTRLTVSGTFGTNQRSLLQGLLQANSGIVAVRMKEGIGGEIDILEECRLEGQYAYQPTTWQELRCDISAVGEFGAGARVPLGAVGLDVRAGVDTKHSRQTSLLFGVRGSYIAQSHPEKNTGDLACAAATHYVSSVSVGAWATLHGDEHSTEANLDLMSIIEGRAKLSGNSRVGIKYGREQACSEASRSKNQQPDLECAAPLTVTFKPLVPADCVLTVSTADGITPAMKELTVGQCDLVAGATYEVSLGGSVAAECEVAHGDRCKQPATWQLKVSVNGASVGEARSEEANSGQHKNSHIWPLNGVKIGTYKHAQSNAGGRVPVALLTTEGCRVGDLQDNKCYFRSTAVRFRRVE